MSETISVRMTTDVTVDEDVDIHIEDLIFDLENAGYKVIPPVDAAAPEPLLVDSLPRRIEREMYATQNPAVKEALRWVLEEMGER